MAVGQWRQCNEGHAISGCYRIMTYALGQWDFNNLSDFTSYYSLLWLVKIAFLTEF